MTCRADLEKPGFTNATSDLRDLGSKLAHLLGADWIRVDAFIDPQSGQLYMTEITYPSHENIQLQNSTALPCGTAALIDGYRGARIPLVQGRLFWQALLKGIGINERAFLEADFPCLARMPPEMYEALQSDLFPVPLTAYVKKSPRGKQLLANMLNRSVKEGNAALQRTALFIVQWREVLPLRIREARQRCATRLVNVTEGGLG